MQWEKVSVSREDAYRIRRVYRRLAKMQGKRHLRRLPQPQTRAHRLASQGLVIGAMVFLLLVGLNVLGTTVLFES